MNDEDLRRGSRFAVRCYLQGALTLIGLILLEGVVVPLLIDAHDDMLALAGTGVALLTPIGVVWSCLDLFRAWRNFNKH